MTFDNLDSNFEKRAQEGPKAQLSPEEQHMRNKQPQEEKEKYQATMKSAIQNGILGVFQSKLQSLRTPSAPSNSFDTITVTTDDIKVGPTQSNQTQEVSEKQIQDLVGKKETKQPQVNFSPINSQIEKKRKH